MDSPLPPWVPMPQKIFASLQDDIESLLQNTIQMAVASCTDLCVQRAQATYEIMVYELVQAAQDNGLFSCEGAESVDVPIPLPENSVVALQNLATSREQASDITGVAEQYAEAGEQWKRKLSDVENSIAELVKAHTDELACIKSAQTLALAQCKTEVENVRSEILAEADKPSQQKQFTWATHNNRDEICKWTLELIDPVETEMVAIESSQESEDEAVAVWKVGNIYPAGIISRCEEDLSSSRLGYLSADSLVAELEISKRLGLDRLHYKLLSGNGPSSGWVTVKRDDFQLVYKMAHCSCHPTGGISSLRNLKVKFGVENDPNRVGPIDKNDPNRMGPIEKAAHEGDKVWQSLEERALQREQAAQAVDTARRLTEKYLTQKYLMTKS